MSTRRGTGFTLAPGALTQRGTLIDLSVSPFDASGDGIIQPPERFQALKLQRYGGVEDAPGLHETDYIGDLIDVWDLNREFDGFNRPFPSSEYDGIPTRQESLDAYMSKAGRRLQKEAQRLRGVTSADQEQVPPAVEPASLIFSAPAGKDWRAEAKLRIDPGNNNAAWAAKIARGSLPPGVELTRKHTDEKPGGGRGTGDLTVTITSSDVVPVGNYAGLLTISSGGKKQRQIVVSLDVSEISEKTEPIPTPPSKTTPEPTPTPQKPSVDLKTAPPWKILEEFKKAVLGADFGESLNEVRDHLFKNPEQWNEFGPQMLKEIRELKRKK